MTFQISCCLTNPNQFLHVFEPIVLTLLLAVVVVGVFWIHAIYGPTGVLCPTHTPIQSLYNSLLNDSSTMLNTVVCEAGIKQ